jgi:methionyl-tRNA synthetase
MGKYVDDVLEHIEKNKYILPESRKQEIINRIKEGVHDLSVSRSTFEWGIPLPNDPTHVLYVWFDALLNYYTGPRIQGKNIWPADCHVIGKDIQWFHTMIWLAILRAADLPFPKHVLIHGFINDKNGMKMSKSLGNVVDPLDMVDKYGLDAFRYYLLRSFPLDSDARFNEEELVDRYNNELGNDYGNLLLRIIKLSKKFTNSTLTKAYDSPFNLSKLDEIKALIEQYQVNRAIDKIWSLLNDANKYMNEKEPWKNEEEREAVLYSCAELTRIVSILLQPVLPHASKQALALLGTQETSLEWGKGTFTFDKETVLFPRIDYEAPPEFPFDLRVGRIIEVQDHPEADKLYVLKVDVGSEVRQIVAGIKAYYSPEELKDLKVIVLCNLKKAKLRGIESQGMLLAADNAKEGDEEVVGLMTTLAEVGTQVAPQGAVISTKQIDYKEFSKHELLTGKETMLVDGVAVSAGKHHVVAQRLGPGNKIC